LIFRTVAENPSTHRSVSAFSTVDSVLAKDSLARLSMGDKLIVVGYPYGRALSLTLLSESAIVDVDEHFLRYRTGTAPGSSGSPVFDNWNLLAMHHASTSVQGE
jgi:V8-like Glu-specific endopeptidase